jgi:hypothetical protein
MDLPQETEAALKAGGEALLSELSLLSEMPQVIPTDKSAYDRAKPPGSVAQLRGVQFRLRCCAGAPLVRKCNDIFGDKACPTVLEAARYLRAKVEKEHGSEACVAKAREKLTAEGSSGAASTEQPRNAFAVMLGARLAIQRAQSAVKSAEQAADERRADALEANKRLEQVRALSP